MRPTSIPEADHPLRVFWHILKGSKNWLINPVAITGSVLTQRAMGCVLKVVIMFSFGTSQCISRWLIRRTQKYYTWRFWCYIWWIGSEVERGIQELGDGLGGWSGGTWGPGFWFFEEPERIDKGLAPDTFQEDVQLVGSNSSSSSWDVEALLMCRWLIYYIFRTQFYANNVNFIETTSPASSAKFCRTGNCHSAWQMADLSSWEFCPQHYWDLTLARLHTWPYAGIMPEDVRIASLEAV